MSVLQVNNLKVQLFEKLEQFLVDLHLEYKEIRYASSGLGGIPVSASSSAHEVCQSNIFDMLGNSMLAVICTMWPELTSINVAVICTMWPELLTSINI